MGKSLVSKINVYLQNVGRISSGFETKLKFYLLLSIKHEIH